MTSHVRTPKRAGRLSDRQLADLAREYRSVKAQAKVEEEHAKEIAAELLAELEARQVETADVEGVRVSRRQRAVRKVNLLKLRTAITPSLFRRVTTVALDTKRWNGAVEAGLVDDTTLKLVEDETPSAAWVDVSEVA